MKGSDIMRTMPQFEPTDGYQFAGSGMGGGDGSLPIASENTLGGVKIGEGLSITPLGVLSALSGGLHLSTQEHVIGDLDGVPLYSVTSVGQIGYFGDASQVDKIIFACAFNVDTSNNMRGINPNDLYISSNKFYSGVTSGQGTIVTYIYTKQTT